MKANGNEMLCSRKLQLQNHMTALRAKKDSIDVNKLSMNYNIISANPLEDLKYRACVLWMTFMMRFWQFCRSLLLYEEEQPGYSSNMYLLCSSEEIKLYEFETA